MATTALRYPGDLADGSGDYVSFTFFEYVAPYAGGTTKSTKEAYDEGKDFTKSDLSPIQLYMPEDISASYSTSWGGRKFGPLAPLALSMAGDIMGAEGQSQQLAAGESFGKKVGDMMGGAMPYIGASIVAKGMNRLPGMGGGVTANDILATTRGNILNPNTEVIFDGPELRNFTLNFKMMARSKGETDNIQSICNTFKKASLPSQGTDTLLIGVPNICKVKFMHKGDAHKYVTQFKCAAITSVNINYTPDGSWATYVRGEPIAIGLQVQFLELKLVYKEDVDKGF
jgi:hypothetical protein